MKTSTLFALNFDAKQHILRSESKTKCFGSLKNVLFKYILVYLVPTCM